MRKPPDAERRPQPGAPSKTLTTEIRSPAMVPNALAVVGERWLRRDALREIEDIRHRLTDGHRLDGSADDLRRVAEALDTDPRAYLSAVLLNPEADPRVRPEAWDDDE